MHIIGNRPDTAEWHSMSRADFSRDRGFHVHDVGRVPDAKGRLLGRVADHALAREYSPRSLGRPSGLQVAAVLVHDFRHREDIADAQAVSQCASESRHDDPLRLVNAAKQLFKLLAGTRLADAEQINEDAAAIAQPSSRFRLSAV